MKDNTITIFLTGLGIGAAAALILAPHSGAELRGRIRRRADEALDYAKDRANAVADQVHTAVAGGKRNLGDQAAELESAVSHLGDKAKDTVDHAARVAKKATDRILAKSKDLTDQAITAMENEGNLPRRI
jgi:gas vesicle protein